jgi:hypothetical protein
MIGGVELKKPHATCTAVTLSRVRIDSKVNSGNRLYYVKNSMEDLQALDIRAEDAQGNK